MARPRKPESALANKKAAVRKRKPRKGATAAKGVPQPPPWLPERLVAEFKRRAKELAEIKHCDARDADALAALVVAADDFAEAEEVIRLEGRYQENSRGVTLPHPAVKDRKDALAAIQGAIRALGISPTTRGQVEAPPAEEEVDPRKARLAELRRKLGGAKGP